jgi:hypothetical protein
MVEEADVGLHQHVDTIWEMKAVWRRPGMVSIIFVGIEANVGRHQPSR